MGVNFILQGAEEDISRIEKGTKIPTIHAIKNKVNVILSFLCLLFWNIRPLIKLFDKIPKRGLSKQRMLKMKNI